MTAIDSDNVRAVQLLIKDEEGLARLYQAYALKFPIFAPFWSQVASDELRHADWVRELMTDVQSGTVVYRASRFNPELFCAYLDEIDRQIKKATTEKMTLFDALSTALFFERTYIEKNFFEIFESDTEMASRILDMLAGGTREHARRIEELWERYRPKE